MPMPIDPLAAVTGLLALAVAAGAVALARQALQLREVRRALAGRDETLAALRREVERAVAVAAKGGERLRKLEQSGAQLADRLGQLELRGEGRPYDQAIDLVRHGADADRLVRNFGLTRGEADLVELVHGRRRAG
jgi:hypothetical protein